MLIFRPKYEFFLENRVLRGVLLLMRIPLDYINMIIKKEIVLDIFGK